MGIDYLKGFRDATKVFENETNSIIRNLKGGTKKEMVTAIDTFIASVYVLRLQYEIMEEKLFEEMEEEINCEECDYADICEDLTKYIEQLFKEEI